jgi:hypothetical protein
MTDEPGQPNPSGEVRASDAEREAVVERLRVATVEGRLTLGELTERTEAADTATTRSELVPITADLPAVSGSPATPARPTGRGDREWVVAVMGDSKRQGRWRVERPLAALAIMGTWCWTYAVLRCHRARSTSPPPPSWATSRSMFPTAWTYS